MGMLDICSHNSYWRGLDYFESKRVKTLKQINQNEYEAEVEGTEVYFVHLDTNHPKKSTCTCPHAAGKSTICKHKVAVYFSVFPEEAQEAIDERDRYYKDYMDPTTFEITFNSYTVAVSCDIVLFSMQFATQLFILFNTNIAKAPASMLD